jgi:hypothetical protein
MDAATREFVRRRANWRCEYCLLSQQTAAFVPFHIEHIVARQHGGSDETDNLALACFHCNVHKGTNLTGIDSQSGQIVPLFHPRREIWAEHFRISGSLIVGISAMGRVTVNLLQMNSATRQEIRALSNVAES